MCQNVSHNYQLRLKVRSRRSDEFDDPACVKPTSKKVDEIDFEDDNKMSYQSAKRSFWGRIGDFFDSTRVRLGVGMSLLLVSAYILIVVVSFFFSGDVDQSKIHNISTEQIVETGEQVKNVGAAFGAQLSEYLVAKGIGISIFVVIIWAAIIGIRMLMRKKMHFFSFTLISIIAVCAISMLMGLIGIYCDASFFSLGGDFGKCYSEYLMKFVGVPGLVIVNIFLCMLWLLCCKDNIVKIYSDIVRRLPKLPTKTPTDNIEDGSEETDSSTDDSDTPDLAGFDDFPEEGECDADKEDKEDESKDEDDIEVGKETDKVYDIVTKSSRTDDDDKAADDGIMKVAPTIEMGNGKVVEAYDPTKELANFKFPTLDLLRDIPMKAISVDVNEQEENKKRIKETLLNYGIPIKQIDVCVGPTITLFEIVPADGVRISKIKSLEDDIALSLAALGIRIIAPIPGRGTIGIEVPNRDPQTVSMRSVLGSKKFQNFGGELPMALGCTITNDVFIADLAKMPHLLVAGATGQGKSVGLNAIITSLLYKKHPAELKFVLIDPKQVEFSLYGELENHYLAKLPEEDRCIITDSDKVVPTLNSLVTEMESRYELLREARVRNIKEYNAKFINRELNPEKGHHYMPYIVVIIDEFCDLIMEAGKDVERPIVRIAQKARAIGIHMIIATQRPSTNVITGLIKANFPGRVAFKVTQMVDSRTILDCSGAQQLIGKGDMLFSANGTMTRIQCAFIDTPEVEKVCLHVSDQVGYGMAYELPPYVPEDNGIESGIGGSIGSHDRDPLFEEAAVFIVAGETASTSSLQRKFGIGYNRAGRMMDQMEAAGIVGPSQGGKPRRVLVDSIQLSSMLNN